MSRSRLSCALSCLLLALIQVSAAYAQVVRDGSIGPDPSVQPQGPAFQIPDSMGEAVGGNLFHSFSLFNVNAGESVTFLASSSIHNIFARVTGGGSSFVDGRIRAPANLFLANPFGLVFGAGALLDVSGSFHALTADYVEFADRARFYTSRTPGSVLTVADPRQFGFLGDHPSPITVDGSWLNAPRVSLIGGAISIRDGLIGSRLEPPALGVEVVSVAASATVGISNGGAIALEGFSRLGDIDISYGDLVASGPVTIRGGKIVASGASDISSASIVDIDVDRLELSDSARISTSVTGPDGQIGDIFVTARRAIDIYGGISALTFSRSSARRSVQLFTPALTIDGGFIETDPKGAAAGSNLLLDVGDFRLLNGGYVRSSPSGRVNETAPGGDIDIRATGLVKVAGPQSNINTSTFTNGAAGALRIDAARVHIANGGNITSGPPPENIGIASGGNVDIRARESIEITDSENFTGISSTTFTAAKAGNVSLTAPRIVVVDGTAVTASTQSSGDAGQIHITADSLIVADDGVINSGTSRNSSGRGGSVTVDARNVTLDEGQITTNSSGAGQAGNVTITASEVQLLPFGGITSVSNASSTGDAGTVTIRADRLQLGPFSEISTESAAGAGGEIRLDVRQWIEAFDSAISTSVQGGVDGGGDITITMGGGTDVAVMILDSSRLTAQARGNAPGGNMRIVTGVFVPEAPPASTVSASSEFGVAGQILIDEPDTSILTTLTTLPAVFLDAVGLIRAACNVDRADHVTSLIARDRGGLPPAPGGLLPATDSGGSEPSRSGPMYSARVVGTAGDGRPVLLAVRCGA